MRIEWIHGSPSTTTVLCHGGERGVGKATGPDALTVTDHTNIQVDKRIRAAAATLFDRANLLHELSFGVQETFATAAAATVAMHTRRAALPVSGLARLHVSASVGLEYQHAMLEITNRLQRGVNITWQYKITASTVVEVVL